jgi:hypothetical protein
MYLKKSWRTTYLDTSPGGCPGLICAIPNNSAMLGCFRLRQHAISRLSRCLTLGQYLPEQTRSAYIFYHLFLIGGSPKDFDDNLCISKRISGSKLEKTRSCPDIQIKRFVCVRIRNVIYGPVNISRTPRSDREFELWVHLDMLCDVLSEKPHQ